jgi:hypothetical protein
VDRTVAAIVRTSLVISGSRAWEYSKNLLLSAISWFTRCSSGFTAASARAR